MLVLLKVLLVKHVLAVVILISATRSPRRHRANISRKFQ